MSNIFADKQQRSITANKIIDRHYFYYICLVSGTVRILEILDFLTFCLSSIWIPMIAEKKSIWVIYAYLKINLVKAISFLFHLNTPALRWGPENMFFSLLWN